MGVPQLIMEFARQEKGPIAGYVILLLLGTVVSLVGMTKVTAAMYKSVGDNDSKMSFKLLVALLVLSAAFTVTNWGIDYIENRLMPSFHRYVRTKVTQSIIDANETGLMTNTNALRFRAYVSASTSASTTIFNAIVKQYVPNIIMGVVLIGFLFYLSPLYGGVFLGAIRTGRTCPTMPSAWSCACATPTRSRSTC
jgi:ABC-type multidrug transport system fused ATPase/permease subunit